MPDDNSNKNTSAPSPATSSSPWDEPLPEEQPKSQVAGNMAGAIPDSVPSQPFVVPENVESSMPPVVKAADLSMQASASPKSGDTPTPVASVPASTPMPTAPAAATLAPEPKKAVAPPAMSEPAPADDIFSDDVSDEGQSNISAKLVTSPAPNSLDSISGVAPAAKSSSGVFPSVVQETVPKPEPIASAEQKPTPLSAQPVGMMPALPSTPKPMSPPTQDGKTAANTPVVPAENKGLSGLFGGKQNVSDEKIKAAVQPRNVKAMILYAVLGLVMLIFIGIYLTEIGSVSLGFEKIYGRVGLEKIWKGLPADSETALAESFVITKSHPQFKLNGTISVDIDKTIRNPITTPMISESENITKIASTAIQAVLASATSTTDTSTSSSATSNSSSATDTQTTDITSLSTTPPDKLTTKVINATVSGNFGASGNSMEFKVDSSNTVELKNSNNQLWVKSDKFIFNEKAESGKWLLYHIAQLDSNNTNFVSQAVSIEQAKGFSTEGERDANEKIGSVRCYKYSIRNAEIGDSLSNVGVSSDSIQNISGTAWIGIKDKLIRRLDLKITPSPSEPVIQINLSFTFSDYDANNTFAAPSGSDVIDLSAKAKATSQNSTILDSSN